MIKKYAPFIVLLLVLFTNTSGFSGNTEPSSQEKQEFDQIYSQVVDKSNSASQGINVDFIAYNMYADSIDLAWRGRNREYYAKLMAEICKPLESGVFKTYQQYDMARKYAISALESPDSIPLRLEMDLIGFVMFPTSGSNAPVGAEYAQKRVTDATIRLHAWKRLLDGIDPNWDSSKIDFELHVTPPNEMLERMGFFISGMNPDRIQDSTLRAEYKELIRVNQEKRERYWKQYDYREWLVEFSEYAESYIIDLYSHPPFALDELKKMLNNYLSDKAAKDRILQAVEKNMRDWPNVDIE